MNRIAEIEARLANAKTLQESAEVLAELLESDLQVDDGGNLYDPQERNL